MYKEYVYHSSLAPYIRGLIDEKHSLGFSYELEAYILKKFDDYWILKGYTETSISRKSLEEWMVQKETEGRHYRDQRVSFVRQLSLYMCSLGINSYIPKGFVRSVRAVQGSFPLNLMLRAEGFGSMPVTCAGYRSDKRNTVDHTF